MWPQLRERQLTTYSTFYYYYTDGLKQLYAMFLVVFWLSVGLIFHSFTFLYLCKVFIFFACLLFLSYLASTLHISFPNPLYFIRPVLLPLSSFLSFIANPTVYQSSRSDFTPRKCWWCQSPGWRSRSLKVQR